MPDLVGVNEAGRRLGIHPAQISRGLKAGIISNHGTDDRPLVDVEEARRSRAANLDHAKQHGRAAPLSALTPVDDPAETAAPADPSYSDARREHELAKAEIAKLELARLRGFVLNREKTVNAFFEIGAALRESLDARRTALSDRLAHRDSVVIAAELADADHVLLNGIAEDFARRFGGKSNSDDNHG